MLALADIAQVHIGCLQPGVPVVLVKGRVQQQVVLQVGGFTQWHGTFQDRAGADGRQLFIEQRQARQRGVGWWAIDHRSVEGFALEIHAVPDRGGQFHRHVRPLLLPLQQTRQQPAHDTGRGLELQGLAFFADLLDSVPDQAEHLLHPG
ncbi:hypothetical protein D3C76_1447960 [compost metagenome]